MSRQPRGRPGPVMCWRPAVLRCLTLLPRDPGLSTGSVRTPVKPPHGLSDGLVYSLPVGCVLHGHPFAAALCSLAMHAAPAHCWPHYPDHVPACPIPTRLDRLRLWLSLWLADVPPGFVDRSSAHSRPQFRSHARKEKNRPNQAKLGKIRGGVGNKGFLISYIYLSLYFSSTSTIPLPPWNCLGFCGMLFK